MGGQTRKRGTDARRRLGGTDAAAALACGEGFNLIELVIAMAALAIIAGLAYPSYRDHVIRARRADGHAVLMEVMAAQERYYARGSTFAASLIDLGYATNTLDSREGYYRLESRPCASAPLTRCVRLTASPIGPQTDDTECGALTLDSYGTRTISGAGRVEECW